MTGTSTLQEINGTVAQSWRDIAELSAVREICGTCGEMWDGPLRDVRAEFQQHVRDEHPELAAMLDVARLRPRQPQATVRDEFGVLRRLAELAA